MKPKYVQTKVQHHSARKAGDAPSLGPVARMPGAGIPRQLKRRSKSQGRSDSTRDKRQIRKMQARRFAIMLKFSLVLFLCLCALVGGLFFWLRSQGDRQGLATNQTGLPALAMLNITDFPPPSERDAVLIVTEAFAARTPDEVIRLFRPTDEVTVEAILEFLADTPERDGKITSHQWHGTTDTDTLQIQSVLVMHEKDGRMGNRMAMLIPNEVGDWQVDFSALARHCDPPIQTFTSVDGYPGGLVRVYFGLDYYFNGPFRDEKTWACYGLASPDSETTGFAYCKVGSPQNLALEYLIAQGQKLNRVTLRIQPAEDGEPRQFLIEEVSADGWVLGDEPYDQRFK